MRPMALACLLLCLIEQSSLLLADSVEVLDQMGGSRRIKIASLVNEQGALLPHFLDVKSLHFAPQSLAPEESKIAVELTNGDLLFIDRLKIVDEVLTCEFDHHELLISIEYVRHVTWTVKLPAYRKPGFHGQGPDDIIELQAFDRIVGEFIELDSEELQVVTDLGLMKVPVGKLKSLHLSDQLSVEVKRPDYAYECYFVNGSVITVDTVTFDLNANQVQLTLGSVYSLTLPIVQLARIEIWSERFQRITSKQLVDYTGQSFFGSQIDLQVDANANGQLLINAERFAKSGFGVRSGSSLVFRVPSEAVALGGSVGLDRRAGEYGAVEVEILIDGQSLWKGDLGHKSQPLYRLSEIEFPESESRKSRLLEFIFQFGAAADIGDLVNLQNIYLMFPNEH